MNKRISAFFYLIWIFGLFILLGCNGVQRAKKIAPQIIKGQHEVFITGEQRNHIDFHYIGCGGFLLKKEETAILVDPYFSNIGPLFLLPFKKLKPDTALINAFFEYNFQAKKDAEGKIKMLLVGHSHYDHIADVPRIYHHNINQDSTQIMGSTTTLNLLHGAKINNEIRAQTILDITEIARQQGYDYQWIYANNRKVRTLPILTDHAPHLMGLKLISSKSVNKKYEKFPRKARKLPEGLNFNFLIDFLDEKENIDFRIFSHATAASTAGVGFPPKELIDEKPVDVLLICVASYNQAKDYPYKLINLIQPKHIILTHWENFFRPIRKLKKKPATVPATDVVEFVREIEEYVKKAPYKTGFSLPNPDTKISIRTRQKEIH